RSRPVAGAATRPSPPRTMTRSSTCCLCERSFSGWTVKGVPWKKSIHDSPKYECQGRCSAIARPRRPGGASILCHSTRLAPTATEIQPGGPRSLLQRPDELEEGGVVADGGEVGVLLEVGEAFGVVEVAARFGPGEDGDGPGDEAVLLRGHGSAKGEGT